MSKKELIASENELFEEYKRGLAILAERDPNWRMLRGRESLSATQMLERLNTDKKFTKLLILNGVGLALEMVKKAREKFESDSGTPQI
jgi:hypothetical protein